MSLALPAGLPAHRTLLAEGIEVLDPAQLRSRGRRVLRLCLVNLMPNKAVTETQFARLLGGTSIPVELVLCLPDGYRSKPTSVAHLEFYRPWTSIRHEPFDGLIVTGAPIEPLAFEEVTYWSGLCALFDWASARSLSSFYVCWAAQAALHHFHGIPKHRLPQKIFGVFGQRVTGADSALLRGLGEEFPAAVSRHTEVRTADLPIGAGLSVLAASPDAGLCLLEDRARRTVYMFNHLEYDAETLRDEFVRDRLAGKPGGVPRSYFPEDDPARAPANVWRPYGQRLFANWLAEIYRGAEPTMGNDPIIQWALARPQTISPEDDHADLLVSANGERDVVPAALRALAEAGLAPRALKVHRLSEPGQLIELRLDRLEQSAVEGIARRLCTLPMISKVAFRIGGNGGWFVGHRADMAGESQAPAGPSTSCEAA